MQTYFLQDQQTHFHVQFNLFHRMSVASSSGAENVANISTTTSSLQRPFCFETCRYVPLQTLQPSQKLWASLP